MKISSTRAGFSLVELSLSLAIIGLLTGGIMAGNSLINGAKLNKVITDLGKYRIAYTKFKEVYLSIPGDYPDATEQWGTDAVTGTCAAPAPIAADRVPKKVTCNGNGDKLIFPNENYRAWQHLSNAGLIEGTFTGVTDAAGGANPGENVPVGPHSNSGFYMDTSGAFSGNPSYFDQARITELVYGRKVSGNWPSGGVLKPAEQYQIDKKIDDSKPAYGDLRSIKNTCVTTTVAATAEYARTVTDSVCIIWMLIDEPVL